MGIAGRTKYSQDTFHYLTFGYTMAGVRLILLVLACTVLINKSVWSAPAGPRGVNLPTCRVQGKEYYDGQTFKLGVGASCSIFKCSATSRGWRTSYIKRCATIEPTCKVDGKEYKNDEIFKYWTGGSCYLYSCKATSSGWSSQYYRPC